MYKFEIVHTNRPFSGPIPDKAWKQLSKHTSLTSAQKRVNKLMADMHRWCGPNGWNDHFAIRPLIDTKMTTYFYCSGYGFANHHHICDKEAAVEYVWKSGDFSPNVYPPAGFASSSQCADCYEKDQALFK